MRAKSSARFVQLLIIIGLLTLTTIVATGSVAAQTGPSVATDSVSIDGSTVTINTGDTAAVAVEPTGAYTATEPSDNGVVSDDGIVWNRPPQTVSFTLTPPSDATQGDSTVLTVTGTESIDYTLTVASQSANYTVSDLSPQSANITVDDQIDISATIENVGGATGEQDIALEIGNNTEPKATSPLTLVSGATETVTFEDVSVSQSGNVTYTVTSANDSAAGTLTIEESSSTTPSDLLVEGTVEKSGSTVTVNHSDANALAVDNFDPSDTTISELSGNGQSQPSGAIWNGPSGDTVSFTLTPPDSASVGDTIEFDVTTDTTETVSVEIVEEPAVEAPTGVSQDVAEAVADDNGEFSPASIALAISSAAENGRVDGVEVGPADFALIISSNSS